VAMDKDREEFQHDWYGILGCEPGTTKELIEKAARKLAAKNHPDKTSDPEAPAKFLLIQKAKEVLTDDAKKKVIDEFYRESNERKKYEETRMKGMDASRKRFREKLDSRINTAQRQRNADPDEVLRQELKKQTSVMEAMRKANQDLLERAAEVERQRVNQKQDDYLRYRQTLAEDSAMKMRQIKIKWKRGVQSHSEDSLYFMLKQFGDVEEVTLLPGKGTSALITFASNGGAKCAMDFYAASEEFRVSYLAEDKPKEKARIFTHNYTSSAGLNEQLGKELERVRELESLRKTASRGQSAGVEGDDLRDADGKINFDKFLDKEKRILTMLREYKHRGS
jgi:curved DNA-binding protein CbpA